MKMGEAVKGIENIVLMLISDLTGKILLVCKKGVWGLPGGHQEKSEQPTATLLREFFEEIGLDSRFLLGGEKAFFNRDIIDEKSHKFFRIFERNYLGRIKMSDLKRWSQKANQDGLSEVKWFEEEEINGIEISPVAKEAIVLSHDSRKLSIDSTAKRCNDFMQTILLQAEASLESFNLIKEAVGALYLVLDKMESDLGPLLPSDSKILTKQVILIVESDDEVRSGLVDSLKRLGHVVVPYADFSQAFGDMDKIAPIISAALLDYNLPAGKGESLAREIKSRNKAVKVIIITGSSVSRKVQKLEKEGLIDKILYKPFTMERLKTII